MKLNAVKGRGVKKEFWDVAQLLKIYSVKELFQFYEDRYIYDDSLMLARSFAYFNDAEDSLDPECLNGMTWNKVKMLLI